MQTTRDMVVIGLFLFISSCGGSDGPRAVNNNATNTVNSSEINNSSNNPAVFSRQSALPGKLSFAEGQRAWVMSLSDGTYTSINAAPWAYPNPLGDPAVMSVPGGQSDEFVVSSLGDCLLFDEFSRREEFCVNVYSFGNEGRLSFWLPGKLQKPALLSNDGQYFLVQYKLNNANVFQIGARDLEQVALTRREDIVDFDWLPDNRILLASNKEIIITDAISFEQQQAFELKAFGLAGDICSVSSNQDGTRVLVNVTNNEGMIVNACVPWVFDLSDGSHYQLATTLDESALRFGSMDWSPDGKWIFLQNGVSADTFMVNASSRGYVVPTDKQDNPLIISTVEQERSSEVIPVYRHQISGGDGADLSPNYDNPLHMGFNSSVYWVN